MTQDELFGKKVLEAEMDIHWGYNKNSNEGDNSAKVEMDILKIVLMQDQWVELNIARDSNS